MNHGQIKLIYDQLIQVSPDSRVDQEIVCNAAETLLFVANELSSSLKRNSELEAELVKVRGTAEYWKAEHLAGNAEIAALKAPASEPVVCKHEWFRTGAMEPNECRCIHCGMWNTTAPPNTDELVAAFRTFIDEHEECTDADDWMASMCSLEAMHEAGEALAKWEGK